MTRRGPRRTTVLGLAALLAAGSAAGGEPASVTGRIASARVGVLFQRLSDGMVLARGDDVPSILAGLHTDVVFRAWFSWWPCPPDCEGLPPGWREDCASEGYSYRHLADAIAAIRAVRPGIVVIGAIPAQELPRTTFVPGTFDLLDYPETWDMALDPGKWGLPLSKKQFQCYYGRSESWVEGDCATADAWYDPARVPAYFPDLTDPRVQALLRGKARAQIEAGADAIWVDLLVAQARLMYRITCGTDGTTCDPAHPAVLESYAAARDLVEGIRADAAALGRDVAVGSWGSEMILDVMTTEPPPPLDFVTATPSAEEVLAGNLDPSRWDEWLASVRATYGDVPVIAFIDWASTSDTPLGVFSQVLSPAEQREFLRRADAFFAARGILFAYPVHGGYMGNDATVLSHGRWFTYDSMAPEFDTYGTIQELARLRAGARPPRRPRGRVHPPGRS